MSASAKWSSLFELTDDEQVERHVQALNAAFKKIPVALRDDKWLTCAIKRARENRSRASVFAHIYPGNLHRESNDYRAALAVSIRCKSLLPIVEDLPDDWLLRGRGGRRIELLTTKHGDCKRHRPFLFFWLQSFQLMAGDTPDRAVAVSEAGELVNARWFMVGIYGGNYVLRWSTLGSGDCRLCLPLIYNAAVHDYGAAHSVRDDLAVQVALNGAFKPAPDGVCPQSTLQALLLGAVRDGVPEGRKPDSGSPHAGGGARAMDDTQGEVIDLCQSPEGYPMQGQASGWMEREGLGDDKVGSDTDEHDTKEMMKGGKRIVFDSDSEN